MADPAQTVDLALDDGDMAFASRDLSTVSGAALVEQRLSIGLQMFKGEWFLDANAGLPWFQEILKKGVAPAVVDAIIRAAILKTEGVNRLLVYESSIDAESRTISVAFTADTVYGPVEFEGALV